MVTERAKELIKGFEAYRHYAYRDGNGIWTCGYGHTKGVSATSRCSMATALRWLDEDCAEVDKALARLEREGISLNDNQKTAISSFIFNIGATRFFASTLFKVLAVNPDSKQVGSQMMRWVYIGKRRSRGLEVRRRKEVAVYYGE